ncbi:MAG TPA: dienelactone hydrolase family protein [Burkholderiaceae bacterium]|jgi:carboxymethylenebutenolidase|nr:dienelactone hydrolase family protein [Burkholderiaceae bacterium]
MVNTRWIDIAGPDGKFPGYLALPPTGKGRAIIITQEIFGVNEHIRSVAEQYASDGYVVLAPDIFWRSKPHIELGYSADDMAKGVGFMEQVDMAKTLGDIAATAKTLRAMPEVTGKLAAVGYCFGGRLAYLSAANGSVDAAVPYYGGGIQNYLDQAGKIKTPILFHYAENDGNIPMSAVANVKKSFAGRDNATFFIYPDADHGFNCWARGTYQQKAAALAHGRTLQFLAENL